MKAITLLIATTAVLSPVVFHVARPPQDSKPASVPTAAKADVESVDAIVNALYDVISGPAGKERDWNRFRSLFIAKAQLIAVIRASDGSAYPIIMTPDDYATRAGPRLVQAGFFEREIARRTEAFADIAHVFSTYESRNAASDEKPFARGINSIQLMKNKDRWRVVSIFWSPESEAYPIPPAYLPK